jgi:hypothetical protein
VSQHPAIEFRYIGFARDFPARAALEHVLCSFIDAKRDKMQESDLSNAIYEVGIALLEETDDQEAEKGSYPNRDIWLRFEHDLNDLLCLSTDAVKSKDEINQFKIEMVEGGEWGDDEEDDAIPGRWASVKSYITFAYSSAALTLRFSRSMLGGQVDCTCWVQYAEGDGEDVKMAANAIGWTQDQSAPQ